MDYGLRGKRALVTGASRGLGAATAELLAAEGAHVIAASRSGRATNAPAFQRRAIRGRGGTALITPVAE